MTKVSGILVAIDGDYDHQALLAEVVSIAKNGRSPVTILSITEPLAGDPEKDAVVSNLQQWESEARSKKLEELSAALSRRGIQVAIQYAIGKPHLEIIRKTLNSEYDLVIKPAKHDRGITRLLLGGRDIQLLSLCPIPVWIFQPTVSRALKKVAVAVDLQANDPGRRTFADEVLGWGKFVAKSVGAELHVIHTWSLYREELLRARTAISEIIDNLSDNKERLHRNWLHDAVQQAGLGNDKVHEHLVKGEARELIPQIADELNIDLLVMGTVGRTGIPGFFIGNTADSVLRNVSCSVFAVKPKKFTTPVEPASQD